VNQLLGAGADMMLLQAEAASYTFLFLVVYTLSLCLRSTENLQAEEIFYWVPGALEL
jgi:hypothetical protein